MHSKTHNCKLQRILVLAPALVLLVSAALPASRLFAAAEATPATQSQFICFTNFVGFSRIQTRTALAAPRASAPVGSEVLLSPRIKAPIAWNELVVSWNVSPETLLKVEAKGIYPDHETRFYNLALWANDAAKHPREGFKRERDADGGLSTDTLVFTKPGADVQLRITLCGPGEKRKLKFLGLSFADTSACVGPVQPNRAAWGKILEVPERSQLSYPQEKGWCSATSLSMVLSSWANRLQRPEMDIDVPEVASGIFDRVMNGTGNWPFNTAFAGKFPGMRAYVSRLSDVSELEDWIAAGIPVIISAPYYLLNPDAQRESNGHVVTCIGFTKTGDVVINDPATNFKKGMKVRRYYKRENVIKAWAHNHNTVYLIYPETAVIPPNRFGHWEER